jgi:hypothetical protein
MCGGWNGGGALVDFVSISLLELEREAASGSSEMRRLRLLLSLFI